MSTMKPIVKIPNNVLVTVAKPVTSFDKRLTRLIEDLKSTLIMTKNPKGVGLAAPQIGESVAVFIMRPYEKNPIRVFINPEIIARSGETEGVPERENKLEGCLSIPAVWGRVKRASKITVRYQDLQGAKHEETFHGFPATIIQHEMDHLNGVLFTYRVLEQRGKFYQTGKDKDGKEILEEIELK
jgi:peptide deformylase